MPKSLKKPGWTKRPLPGTERAVKLVPGIELPWEEKACPPHCIWPLEGPCGVRCIWDVVASWVVSSQAFLGIRAGAANHSPRVKVGVAKGYLVVVSITSADVPALPLFVLISLKVPPPFKQT